MKDALDQPVSDYEGWIEATKQRVNALAWAWDSVEMAIGQSERWELGRWRRIKRCLVGGSRTEIEQWEPNAPPPEYRRAREGNTFGDWVGAILLALLFLGLLPLAAPVWLWLTFDEYLGERHKVPEWFERLLAETRKRWPESYVPELGMWVGPAWCFEIDDATKPLDNVEFACVFDGTECGYVGLAVQLWQSWWSRETDPEGVDISAMPRVGVVCEGPARCSVEHGVLGVGRLGARTWICCAFVAPDGASEWTAGVYDVQAKIGGRLVRETRFRVRGS